MASLRLLGCNPGYFLGYDGRIRSYLRHPIRGIIGGRGIEEDRMQVFSSIVEDTDPEVIGLVEIDQGSLRTRTDGQATALARGLDGYQPTSDHKYRQLPGIRQVPVLGGMANGALYRGDGEIHHHRLGTGWKRLLTELRIDGLSVFIAHLPLPPFRRTRRRQLAEIADIMDGTGRYVLYGDLNDPDPDRMQELLPPDSRLHVPGPTYPTTTPRHPYDCLVTGPRVTAEDVAVLDRPVSDHLPLLADLRY